MQCMEIISIFYIWQQNADANTNALMLILINKKVKKNVVKAF